MKTIAAVMTDTGVAAISTIGLYGGQAENILRKIFTTSTKAAGNSIDFKAGRILFGRIVADDRIIDEVTIGCEAEGDFAVNCHGNPLIVGMIMQLLSDNGVEPVSYEKFLAERLSCRGGFDTIAVEAVLARTRAVSLEAVKIITNQVEGGLTEKLRGWQQLVERGCLDEIKAEAEQILAATRKAGLVIDGCTAVLTGPANSGKSTLLNCLCGTDKAIVTDKKGTTRDWISGHCRIGPLYIELIDTAGFCSVAENSVDRLSQVRAIEMLGRADLVLLVLDGGIQTGRIDERLLRALAEKKVLVVLNKSDLPFRIDAADLPAGLTETVKLSAKYDEGIDALKEKLLQITSVADFDSKAAVCFTGRQRQLLGRLCKAESAPAAAAVITELLNGDLCV